MKKLIKILSKIPILNRLPEDKQLHVFFGSSISAVNYIGGFLIAIIFGYYYSNIVLVGVIVGATSLTTPFLAGLIREWYMRRKDRKEGKQPRILDWKDVFYTTVAGWLTVAILNIIRELIIK